MNFWIIKLIGSCCQSRPNIPAIEETTNNKADLPKELNENAVFDKFHHMGDSRFTDVQIDVLASDHEILMSRSERLEKLILSRGLYKHDFSIQMDTSRRTINYCRSASDVEKKMIQIGDTSFCDTKEFAREDSKVEKLLGVKHSMLEQEEPNNKKRKKRNIKIWTPQEDELLKKYYETLGNKWELIAEKIPGRNGSQCSQRWRRKFRLQKVRKNWTEEEDKELLKLARVYGTNWNQIAVNMKGTRNGKQVRERYLNKLDPQINNAKWREEEDKLIYSYSKQFGPKWSEIKKLLNGRSENMIKNRYYSYIKKTYVEIPGKAKAQIEKPQATQNKCAENLISENDFEQESFEEEEQDEGDEEDEQEEYFMEEEEDENKDEANDLEDDLRHNEEARIMTETCLQNHEENSINIHRVESLDCQKLFSTSNRLKGNYENEKGFQLMIDTVSKEPINKHLTISSFDNHSRGVSSRNESIYTTFYTDEKGLSLYPLETKSRELASELKEMDKSDELEKNIVSEEKLDLKRLLRHGTSLYSEEYNPTPKKEAYFENYSLGTERNENIFEKIHEGSEVKERDSKIELESPILKFPPLHSIPNETSDRLNNIDDAIDLESYRANLMQKLAEIDKFLSLKDDKAPN